MIQRLASSVLALAVGTLLGLFSPVVAMAEPTTDCIRGFGTKVPVLMVHGWNGDERVWDSMKGSRNTLSGVAPDTFDYKDVHDQWVTDPAIGHKLAERIDCLSQASLKGKGSGKVIIIAHSMGGLAARYAASQTVSGRKVASELGLVITLGTPHTGSLWGNATTAVATSVCQGIVGSLTFNPLLGLLMTKDMCLANLALKGLSKDSRELQELLRFPANVPVKAIAGHAGVLVQVFGVEIGIDTKSDLVVGVDSATAEHTSTGMGDGTFIFECEGYVSGGLSCSHNGLLQAPQVQAEVKKSIGQYLSGGCLSVEQANKMLDVKFGPYSSAGRYGNVLCDRAITLVCVPAYPRLSMNVFRVSLGQYPTVALWSYSQAASLMSTAEACFLW